MANVPTESDSVLVTVIDEPEILSLESNSPVFEGQTLMLDANVAEGVTVSLVWAQRVRGNRNVCGILSLGHTSNGRWLHRVRFQLDVLVRHPVEVIQVISPEVSRRS